MVHSILWCGPWGWCISKGSKVDMYVVCQVGKSELKRLSWSTHFHDLEERDNINFYILQFLHIHDIKLLLTSRVLMHCWHRCIIVGASFICTTTMIFWVMKSFVLTSFNKVPSGNINFQTEAPDSTSVLRKRGLFCSFDPLQSKTMGVPILKCTYRQSN